MAGLAGDAQAAGVPETLLTSVPLSSERAACWDAVPTCPPAAAGPPSAPPPLPPLSEGSGERRARGGGWGGSPAAWKAICHPARSGKDVSG